MWPASMRLSLAADYLDCSVREVEDLIRAGELECIQYNERGMRRIPRQILDEFISRRLEKRIVA